MVARGVTRRSKWSENGRTKSMDEKKEVGFVKTLKCYPTGRDGVHAHSLSFRYDLAAYT